MRLVAMRLVAMRLVAMRTEPTLLATSCLLECPFLSLSSGSSLRFAFLLGETKSTTCYFSCFFSRVTGKSPFVYEWELVILELRPLVL